MKANVDVNDIIENLITEVTVYVRENAILKAQIKSMNDLLEAQEIENEDVK